MSNDRQQQITSCDGAWTVRDADLYGSELVEDFSSACKWESSSSFYVDGTYAVHELAFRNLPSVQLESSSFVNVPGAKTVHRRALRNLPSAIAAASSFLIESVVAAQLTFWQGLKAA